MEKICNTVQYNDVKGKIYGDKKDSIINVFKKIAEKANIKSNNKFIGLSFNTNNFYLIELLEETDDFCKVKEHKIKFSFDELMKNFKRFSFCISYDENYLDKECIKEIEDFEK
jgi:hypothetical protein